MFSISFAAGEWGLGFQVDGQKPVGNETVEYLQKYNAYYVGSTDEKIIYLTFDAGYENGYTEKILDTLKQENVPAAFFLVGNYYESCPDIVRRMVEEGHIIGNHTMKHPDMPTITDEALFTKQFTDVEALYKDVTGQEMKKYYRPPSGKYSEKNLEMADKLGYKTIFWSLAYNDYNNNNQPSKELAFSKLIPRIHPGAVLLLHNTSQTNSEILGELIKKYKDLGYEFKSLDHLTGEEGNGELPRYLMGCRIYGKLKKSQFH
jgi:peptidoglycan-N-acetylmuramic acid deacetylase